MTFPCVDCLDVRDGCSKTCKAFAKHIEGLKEEWATMKSFFERVEAVQRQALKVD